MTEITPMLAIRRYCVMCVGHRPLDVEGCMGDTAFPPCTHYPYRSGVKPAKGPGIVSPLREIARFCRECSFPLLPRDCEEEDCPHYFYRTGRNPKRAGMGRKNVNARGVGGKFEAQTGEKNLNR